MTTDIKPTLEQWYSQLKELAKGKDLAWLVTDDPLDYQEAYRTGYRPEDVLNEEVGYYDWGNI